MAGEPLFVPTTTWCTQQSRSPQPSFLPGVTAPLWWTGAGEFTDLLLGVESVLILLQLAGYQVDEVIIGAGEEVGEWVSYDPATTRLGTGDGTWTGHTGSAHPASGNRQLAIRAVPMPHVQRSGADTSAPVLGQRISIPMILGGRSIDGVVTPTVSLSATEAGWVVLQARHVAVTWDSAGAVRDQMLGALAEALTTFQSAGTAPSPPGLTRLYDPTNWLPSPSVVPADRARDVVETLSRVTVRLTAGPLSYDAEATPRPVVGLEPALAFLDKEVPHPRRRMPRNLRFSDWTSLRDATKVAGLAGDIDVKAELSDLERLGVDTELQNLTTTILDLHHRELVDAFGGFAAPPIIEDPCTRAFELAQPADLDDADNPVAPAPLTPDDVEVMCACLSQGITADSHLVAARLVADYPLLYADLDSRALIRAALIEACAAADSMNPALNASGATAAELESAEHFAVLLAAALTTEPKPGVPGFDVAGYVNPLLEVTDAWDRWSASLTDNTKFLSLTCGLFRDCGHQAVARFAAQAVINHYLPRLKELERGDDGHHWSHPVFGDEFHGLGTTTRPGLEGWSESLVISLLAMLANTHEGNDLTFLNDTLFLRDALADLVGSDPLVDYDIDGFESAYAELLGASHDSLVREYTLLLGITVAYATAATEADAGRYSAAPLKSRFSELVATQDLLERLEALREEAFVSVPNEWLSVEALQFGIEEFAQSARHQLMLLCLDDERRLAYQEDVVDRVRRVCPKAAEVVLGVFIGVASAIEAGSLIEAIEDGDLLMMLDDVAAVYGFPATASTFTRYLVKVLKEGPVGISKGYFTSTQDAATAMVAARRLELWGPMLASGPPDVGPTEDAITAYLQHVDDAEALAKSIKDDLAPSVYAVTTAGHVVSIFVAGVVAYQFLVEGVAPATEQSALSAGRDVVMGASAGVQLITATLGSIAVKWFGEHPDEWIALVDGSIRVGKVLTKLSSVVTFLVNGVTMVRYLMEDPLEWFGAALMCGATGASAIAALVAVGLITAPVLGAVAATIAAVLVLIDVARKYIAVVGEQGELWQEAVVEPMLLFSGRVTLATPDAGEFSRTVAYQPGDEVSEIGEFVWPTDGGESRDVAGTAGAFTIGEGITVMYAGTTETATDTGVAGDFTVWCPIPAVAMVAVEIGEGNDALFFDDSLLEVRPRFESWVEAPGADFDEVFVDRGDRVDTSTVVATLAGDPPSPLFAPHDGVVGAVESPADPGFVYGRIRIWAHPVSDVR